MTEIFDPSNVHYATVNGIRTRYLDVNRASTGETIVLIHGGHFGIFVPMGIETWSENVGPLSAFSRVVAFDKIGQGLSDLPLKDSDWTFENVLEHAKSLLVDVLNLSNITLVGHSRGGLLAAQLAMKLGDRVRRLVVVSSASIAPTPPGFAGMAFYDTVERTAPTSAGSHAIVAHYHAAQEVAEGPLKAEYLQLAGRMLDSEKHRNSVAGYARNSRRYWIPSLERANRSTLDFVTSSGYDISVLVIWGQQDRSAPIALGHDFFSLLSSKSDDAALHVINRAGHQVFRDQPSSFCEAVSAFLTHDSGKVRTHVRG